jgi:hypothetical protein
MLDGKQPKWEMMHHEAVIGEMSFLQVVEHAAQSASVLRYQDHPYAQAAKAMK